MSDLRDLRYLNYLSAIRRMESFSARSSPYSSRNSSPSRYQSPPRYETTYSNSYSKPRHSRTQSGGSYGSYSKANYGSSYGAGRTSYAGNNYTSSYGGGYGSYSSQNNSYYDDGEDEPIYMSSYSKPSPTYAEMEKDILEKSLRRSRLICADLIRENQELKSGGAKAGGDKEGEAKGNVNLVACDAKTQGLYSLLQNVQGQDPQKGLHI